MRRSALVIPLAAILLVVVATSGVSAVEAGPVGGDDSDAPAGIAVDGADEERDGSVCDYVELYEETIEGVVQVRVEHGGIGQEGPGGLGSGFVYEVSNGTAYVVTNQHVVMDRQTVTIEFSDGEVRTGEVVGTDVYSDLAVVAVEEPSETATSLAIADEQPRPGEPVAALGSPFGLEGTITEGIVSAVDRSLPGPHGFAIPNTVQTDAPINPGNSGGPLVACDGSVVGVNTAGAGQNLGFAVGTPLLERVVPALIEEGEYDHPYLGIESADVTPALAEANDLETTSGVYVHETVPDGPAAGVLEGTTDVEIVDGERLPVGGDVVVAIDGETVRNGETLNEYLATETAPGDEVEVTLIRDGDETTETVTLGERPEPNEHR